MVVGERLRHNIISGPVAYFVFNGDFVERSGIFRLEAKGVVGFLRLSIVQDGSEGGVNTTKVLWSM